MFWRRAESKGSDTPKRVAFAVIVLLGVQGPASVPDAKAADTYSALVSQLNILVARRTVLVAKLSTSDALAGTLALRDFLATVGPPLAAQSRQATLFTSRQPAVQPTTSAAVPSFYRAAAPGALLGAHVPVSAAALGAPATVAPLGNTALSASSEAAPRLPAQYQSLGVAASTAQPHAVEVKGNAVPLPDLAAQARSPLTSVPAVAAPHWYTPSMLSGPDAIRAYSSILNEVATHVVSAASSTSVAEGGLTKNSRPTSAADLTGLLGHYVVNQTGTVAAARAGRPLSSAAWTLSATRPMGDGTTFQVQAQGAVAAGTLRGATYSVFTTRTPATVQQAAPLRLSFDLRLDGSAVVTATEVLSNSTAVLLSARLPDVLGDPDIAAAVNSEQAPLRQLYAVVQAGSLAYAQISPLYNARAAEYEQSFSVAMKKNAVLEQAWWNQTQRWNRYQTALTTWQQHATQWKQYVASRTVAHAASTTPTPTGEKPTATVALTSTITPQPRGIGIPGPGAYGAGALTVRSSTLGVGGGPVVHQMAPAVRTPIFADTPVPPSPVTGGVDSSASATVSATATATVTILPTLAITSSVVSATATATTTPIPVKTSTQVPSPTATPSPTASATTAPSLFTQGRAPSAVPSPQSTFTGGSSTGTGPATPADTFVPSATATATVSATPTRTVSPIDSAKSATHTISPSTTATATATPSTSPTPSVSPTHVKPVSHKGSATVTASPSATATQAIDAPPTPLATATALTGGKSGLLPPGPPPAVVKAPPAQPPYVALPVPLAPLPAWVDAPIDVTPAEEQQYIADGVNAKGYADITSSQLIAGGALNNVSGFLPPIQGMITTFWGGSTPWQSFHPGLDIAGPDGIPVHAAADGIVVFAGLAVPGDPTQSYGNCVVIEHTGHLSTLYGHMQIGLNGLQVQAGQVVRQGQVIGYEGQTGFATGPHVHFEMRLDNVEFDPLLLINENLITG